MRNQYQFEIRHHSQLDFSRISQDLSYANPMATVKVADKTFLLVHRSIVDMDSKDFDWNVVPGLVVEQFPSATLYDCTGNPKGVMHARTRIERIKRSKWDTDSKFHGTVTVSRID